MADAREAGALHRGDSFSIKRVFDAASIADFAERTGDTNPMHRDPGVGAASRFGKRIASAQQTASLMLGSAASWVASCGSSFALGCSFRFTAAVLEGDEIEFRWKVADMVSKDSLNGVIVMLDGTATNAEGRICVRGTLELLLQN